MIIETTNAAPRTTREEQAQTREQVLSHLRFTYRLYTYFSRAGAGLTLQIKALCRRICNGDKVEGTRLHDVISAVRGTKKTPLDADLARAACAELLEARKLISKRRDALADELEAIARTLPAWEWVEGQRGFGALGFAIVAAEAGRDLATYENPAKLWKRFGLALIGSERQRNQSDADLALLHGYSPHRRAVAYNVAAGLVRCGNEHYRAMYDARKAYEIWKLTDGLAHPVGDHHAIYTSLHGDDGQRTAEDQVPRAAPVLDLDAEFLADDGLGCADDQASRAAREKLPKGVRAHAHNRATRYVSKQFLLKLWEAWRDASAGLT